MATTAAEIRAEVRTGSIRMDAGRTRRRRFYDFLGWGLCTLAFLALGSAMVWILATIFVRGFGALSLKVLTHVTVGTGGGLLNAIEGSVLLSFGGILLAIPPGMAAGIYLSEYDRGRAAPPIRFMADVLVGVPSIVIGYFGYVTMVVGLGWKFSVLAGSVALAIISLPYICRTTEMALRQVPDSVREAAFALGANEGKVAMRICVPMALPAILTGILLALAISVGETAPLLYTAGWSNYLWNGHFTNSPIGYLTYVIWAFIGMPFSSAHILAYAAALFVTLFVLIINIVTRVVLDENTGFRRRSNR